MDPGSSRRPEALRSSTATRPVGAGPDNSIGGDRFRLRMSLQEKRAEEAGMISLTMPCKKTSAKVNSQRDLALAA